MRARAVLVVLVPLMAVAVPGTAGAQCPGQDGTLPGSSASVTTVGTGDSQPYLTFYIDDRDVLDLDEDGDAGGIWIYLESNGWPGLQRGGERVTSNPIPPVHIDGILSRTDDCREYGGLGQPARPDTLVY